MKYFFAAVILTLTFAAVAVAKPDSTAQNIKWTRIETDKKELSVAFPPGFIVDAEKQGAKRYFITGWQSDVRMELHVFKQADAKERLRMMGGSPSGETVSSSFTFDGVNGIRDSLPESNAEFSEGVFLASDNYFYILTVSAKDKRKEIEIMRFLNSVQIKGFPLYVVDHKQNVPEETVALADLKTSPEVIEAYNRKPEKTNIKISRELAPPPDEVFSFEKYSRPPIVLEKPYPKFDGKARAALAVKLKINFLANGQIGDITAYSSADKNYVDACIEAARKIKFIPAQLDGKTVDSTDIVDYTVYSSKALTQTTITGLPN
jgi:hypothetical protein